MWNFHSTYMQWCQATRHISMELVSYIFSICVTRGWWDGCWIYTIVCSQLLTVFTAEGTVGSEMASGGTGGSKVIACHLSVLALFFSCPFLFDVADRVRRLYCIYIFFSGRQTMVEIAVLHIRASTLWNMGWCFHFVSDKYIWCNCVPAFRLGSGSSRRPKCNTYCIRYRFVTHQFIDWFHRVRGCCHACLQRGAARKFCLKT